MSDQDVLLMVPPVDTRTTVVSGTAALTSAHILVGNAGNVATDVAMSGDVTISNAGVTAIGANKVTFAQMQAITDGKMLGASGGTAVEEITIGTGLSLAGNTLTATGGGSGGSGSIYPAFTTPVDGDFAWINQGGASTTVNANGSISLLAPASASAVNLRVRKKTAPATPYTITAAFIFSLSANSTASGGLLWRQSSDGKLLTVAHANNSTGLGSFHSKDFTSATVFSADNKNEDHNSSGLLWLRMTDDGANRLLYFSTDGYTFHIFLTETRTTFLTGDEIGFFCNAPSSNLSQSATLYSWAQT